MKWLLLVVFINASDAGLVVEKAEIRFRLFSQCKTIEHMLVLEARRVGLQAHSFGCRYVDGPK